MSRSAPRVVVVGGGYGGATAAKYLRRWSEGRIDVTLVERDDAFVSCPLSNLVIGGSMELADITVAYNGLDQWGVRRVRADAIAIDPVARSVKLAGGDLLPYDRLILSPGVDFIWDQIPSLDDRRGAGEGAARMEGGSADGRLAPPARVAMPDGGVFVIHVPRVPFRCPPGPVRARVPGRELFFEHASRSRR